jgi:hypothetical protein
VSLDRVSDSHAQFRIFPNEPFLLITHETRSVNLNYRKLRTENITKDTKQDFELVLLTQNMVPVRDQKLKHAEGKIRLGHLKDHYLAMVDNTQYQKIYGEKFTQFEAKFEIQPKTDFGIYMKNNEDEENDETATERPNE